MKWFEIQIFLILVGALVLPFSEITAQNRQPGISDFENLPTVKWKFETGKPFFSSPVVDDNFVFIGGTDSILYALNPETGSEIWRFHTKGEIRSTVTGDQDWLFLNGGDGNLYALDKSTGQLIWAFQTKGEKKYDFADYFHSTPVVKEGTVYFGSGDGNFYAVDSHSGQLKWSFETGGIVHTAPALDNGKVFFGSFDGYVYALNLQDGSLAWKFKTAGHRYFPKGEVQGSPSAFNGLVFIGARDYNIYALDQEKGFCHWNKAFSKGWCLNNQVFDSVLYTGSADERILMATDPIAGKEIWKVNVEFLVFGNNAYSQNQLYVGTTNGKLFGFNRSTGKKIWCFETESYQKNRLRYFKPDDSYRDDIYTIIKSNEQFLEAEIELGGVFSTPFVSENVLIFSSTNGILYCLKR